MAFFEQFLVNNFMKLPPWARTASYFTMLGTFIYLLIAPHFINGDVVAEKDGTIRPYRGVEVRTSVEGRTLKFRTNEEGVWSVPLISRRPADVRIAIKHVDTDEWLEVVLAKTDIWSIWKAPHFRITIDESPPRAGVRLVATDPLKSFLETSIAKVFAATAWAGELVLPSNGQQVKDDPALKRSISENVYKIVAATLRKPAPLPTRDLPFSGAGAPSYVHRIDIVRKLEKDYKLLIPDEHWQSLRTSQQLADYIYRRKVLELSNPGKYKVKESYDWTRIENSPATSERPRFRTLETK
jgi:acyl carrier protein